MGSKTQTATQQSSNSTGPQPQFANLLSQQGTNTAALGSTNPSSLVAPVAGFASPQTQAFGVAGQQADAGLQGLATPYIGQADAALQGAGPVTAQSIQAGLNPYINAQVAALQGQLAQQNAITGQQTNSNAAHLGALTGDRSQVAQQIAQNNNNLNAATATAGLEGNAYNSAAQIAQGNQNAALQQGAQYGQLGTTAQNTGLQNVAELLGIGGQQQGQQQAVNNYGAQVAQAPLSLQQWINSQIGGLSGASGSTSTGTGTTTQPGPSALAQIGGLGLGLTGLFGSSGLFGGGGTKTSASGGRVKGYATGGAPSASNGVVAPLDAWDSMPAGQIQPLVAPPKQQTPSLAQASGPQSTSGGLPGGMPSMQSFTQAGQGLGNLWSGLNTTAGAPTMFGPSGAALDSGCSTTVSPTMAGMGNFADASLGGIGSAVSGGMDALGGMAGAGMDALGGMGAAAAGGLGDLASLLPFLLLKRGGRVKGYDDGGDVGPAMQDAATLAMGNGPADLSATPALMQDPYIGSGLADVGSAAPAPAPRMSAGLGDVPPPSQPAQSSSNSGGVNPWLALAAAGFGMAASKSPFVGVAAGEGGLTGLQNLSEQQAQRMQQARLNLEQAKSAQEMAQSKAMAPGELELQQQKIAEAKYIPVDLGMDLSTGQTKKGLYNPVEKTITSFNPDGSSTTRPMGEGAPAAPGSGLPTPTGPNGEALGLDDYLKQIPDVGMRGKVGSVLNGNDTLAAISARNPIYGQQVQRLVYNYDPLFNPTQAANRVAIEKDLAKTQQGHLGAFSASVGKMGEHLNQLVDASKNLQTTPVLVWNRATQAYDTQTGSPNVPGFQAAANVYMHELAKVLKGGSGVPTDADMEGLAKFFSAPMSKDQLRSVLSTWDGAAHAAIDGMDSTNERNIGHTYDPSKHSVITPYAQKQFDKLDNNAWLHPEKAAAPATPKVGDILKGYRFKGGDPKDPHSWEKA